MRSLAATLVLVFLVLSGTLVYLWMTSAPAVSLTPATGPVAASRPLVLTLRAPRGPLKKVTVTALQGDKKSAVLAKGYPSRLRDAQETFTLAQAGLADGPFTLQVRAESSSLLGLPGRDAARSQAFSFDNTPPVVAVLSPAHNIIKGGAGLVVYTVSKEVEKTGVMVADRFFPGYRQGGDFYAALFPFPFDMEPESFVPRVVAVDRAGNERVSGINYHLLRKTFRSDRINLSPQFLDKISAEFKNRYPQAQTPLELFLKVNGELREQNRKALMDLGRQTSPLPLWQGDFLRMPNTAPLGGWAETRSYIHEGQPVDRQTHLGFDLASVVHAPVPAANRGKVVFAGDLGIYGQCVVIDHGLGLQTLYGHLSRIAVKTGDMVEKGTTLGNTGTTGMALGDHLHYGVVVSGVEVDPVEWWDPSWIRNNVTGKLELGKAQTQPPK